MFSEAFSALKRVFDLTIVPVLLAMFMFMAEVMLAGVSWVIMIVGDFIIGIMSWALNAVDLPPLDFSADTFGAKFLDLADLVGLWPAMVVYFAFALAAFISRILTFGIVGNR